RGFPRLTLEMMYEIVRACAQTVAKDQNPPYFRTPSFKDAGVQITGIIKAAELPTNVPSWRTAQGRLSRRLRMKIFDNPKAAELNYDAMTRPGQVSIVDLSDTDSPLVNNLVIAELLRGVLEQQEANYRATAERGAELRRVMIVIEEAHE